MLEVLIRTPNRTHTLFSLVINHTRENGIFSLKIKSIEYQLPCRGFHESEGRDIRWILVLAFVHAMVMIEAA